LGVLRYLGDMGDLGVPGDANAGIGLALTRRLLSENWQVVALNRSGFPQDDREMQEAIKLGFIMS